MTSAELENNQYGYEAEQRWPDNFAESQRRMAKLSLAEQREIFAQHGLIAVSLTQLMLEGAEPHSAEVQEQIANHYRWICNFWTPDLTAYIALGQMYVDDERFKQNYENFGEGPVSYTHLTLPTKRIV